VAILLSQYDAFYPSKGGQGSGPCRLFGRSSDSGELKLHENIPVETFESNMISEDEVMANVL